MAKKKVEEEEEDEEVSEEEEEDAFEEETFKCRVCGKETPMGEGDDMILLCDQCGGNYNIDKIWDDFDNEKILEEKLRTFDLTPYLLKKGPKTQKKTAK